MNKKDILIKFADGEKLGIDSITRQGKKTIIIVNYPETNNAACSKYLATLIQPIGDLDASVRFLNCMWGQDVGQVIDLCFLSDRDLRKFRNFGKKSRAEFVEIMSKQIPIPKIGREKIIKSGEKTFREIFKKEKFYKEIQNYFLQSENLEIAWARVNSCPVYKLSARFLNNEHNVMSEFGITEPTASHFIAKWKEGILKARLKFVDSILLE